MKALFDKYIEAMSTVWSASTHRSESRRMNKVMDLIDGKPEKLWAGLKEYSPYTRCTMWTRVVAFYDWCIDEGHAPAPNPYCVFRKKNKRAFQDKYQRKPCLMTYVQAAAALESIENESLRNRARLLLDGGLRHTESHTLNNGYVIGKGGKERKVYCRPVNGPVSTPEQYSSLLRACKEALGVTPHKLRSIFANELVRKGANPFELKKAMGWSSLATAESYISANDDTIKKMVEAVQGGTPVVEVSESISSTEGDGKRAV